MYLKKALLGLLLISTVQDIFATKKNVQNNNTTAQINKKTTQINRDITQINKKTAQINIETVQDNRETAQINRETAQINKETAQNNKETAQINRGITQNNRKAIQNRANVQNKWEAIQAKVAVIVLVLGFGYFIDKNFVDCARYNEPINCNAVDHFSNRQTAQLCTTPGDQTVCYNRDGLHDWTLTGQTVCAKSDAALPFCIHHYKKQLEKN